MNKKTTIKLGGVPEHFNYPIHIALQEGLFNKENINVEWIEFPDGTGAMNKALRNGNLDMAIILTEGIIRDIAHGNPSKIVQNYVSSPLLWGVHVAEKSKFKTIDELKNASVAISRIGSGSHLMAYIQAQEKGWDTKNLTTVEVGTIDKAVEALTNGQADYFMWEHFMTKHLVDQKIFRRLGDFPTPWPSFVIAAKNTFLKENNETVQLFLKILNTITDKLKNISDIDKKIAEFYNQQQVDVKKWLSLTTWSTEQLSLKHVKSVQKRLLELQMIPDFCENDFFLI